MTTGQQQPVRRVPVSTPGVQNQARVGVHNRGVVLRAILEHGAALAD